MGDPLRLHDRRGAHAGWAAVFWLHALIEEEALQREYGPAYREYMARVRSRIIPGLPI
jgi:protein-S-isoprenylcysteine O-methyltransferase Ste14